jgi:hypothetical protein
MPPSPRSTPRWVRTSGRALRGSLILVTAVWILYLVAMNVFIRTRIFRNLVDADPTSILVEYRSAYSVLPGRIHVEDLRIRGRDSSVEWILSLDRCEFRVSLRDLLIRRFHATDVHGDGLSLRVRQRRPSFTADQMAALPPVPGFSDPPYSGAKPPPLTEADYNLWTLWLEDVTADHVREVWIDTLRYTGDVRILGRWFFRPLRWLEIGPASVEIAGLDVSHGTHEPWFTGVRGALLVTVHPGDVRDYQTGRGIAGYVSMSGPIIGVARGRPIVARLLDDVAVAATDADGPFAAELAIDHGHVRPGTQIRAGPFTPALRRADLDVTTILWADAKVDAEGLGHADVVVRSTRALQGDLVRASMARLDARGSSRDLDLARPLTTCSYAAEVTGLTTDSLRYWKELSRAAPRLAFDSGPTTLDGRVSGTTAPSTLDAGAHLDVRRLAIAGGQAGADVHFVADAKADVVLTAQPREHRYDLSGSRIDLREATFVSRGLEVTIPGASLQARRAVVTDAGVLGSIATDVPEIRIPSVSNMALLFPSPSGVAIEGGEARARLGMTVDLGEGTASGEATLTAPAVRVRVAGASMLGDAQVNVKAKQGRGSTDLSGSWLLFRERRDDPWWGRVDASQATLATRGGLRFRATILAHARDAGPVTTLLSSEAGLPERLALAVLPTSDLSASGEIVLASRLVEARSVLARTDGFGLSLELLSRGTDQTMAMYFVAGPVQAGVGREGDRTSVHLFGAEPWFAARRAAIRATERLYE